MFKKKALQATITVENGNDVKQAVGEVGVQPLPIQLVDMVGVERINITKTNDAIVITAGNDKAIVNIEIKEK